MVVLLMENIIIFLEVDEWRGLRLFTLLYAEFYIFLDNESWQIIWSWIGHILWMGDGNINTGAIKWRGVGSRQTS